MARILKHLPQRTRPLSLASVDAPAEPKTVEERPRLAPWDFHDPNAPHVEVPGAVDSSLAITPLRIVVPSSRAVAAAEVLPALGSSFVAAGRPPARPLPVQLAHWHDLDHESVRHYRVTAQVLGQCLTTHNVSKLLLSPSEPGLECNVAQIAMGLTLETGRRLLIIEADPDSSLATAFDLAEAPGWSEIRRGFPVEQALQDTGWRRLHLIARGNRLASTYLQTEIQHDARRVTEQYDLTVVYVSTAGILGLGGVGLSLDAYCLVARGRSESAPLGDVGGVPFLGTLLINDRHAPQAA